MTTYKKNAKEQKIYFKHKKGERKEVKSFF